MKKLLPVIFFIVLNKAVFAITGISETPFSEYKFQSNECKIIYHNQSRIFIQPYTFYLDGKPYTGEVTLKYREFTDQLDIVLNNIPMNYSSNDKTHVLESGGMFELYAYANGKLLSFGKDKKAVVQMASKFDITGGETYKLNTTTKNWEKKTLFANVPDANVQLPANKQDMWNDNLWLDQASNGDEIVILKGNNFDSIATVRAFTETDADEIRNQAFKTMNVNEMGFYNCDKILNEEIVPLAVEFKLDINNKMLNSIVYVVYKNRNAVISYYPEQLKTDFKLLPNEDFTIFSVAKDGKIAVVDKTFLAQFDVTKYKNKTVVMPMNVEKKSIKTKQELAMLTGL
ncbi:MAG: hypothetical protein U0U67_10745 [Chitinophagales bacterium]